jgi:Periplasmic protease
VQDESFAKSAIINNGNSNLDTFIFLNFMQTSTGQMVPVVILMCKEIIKLKEDKVDGIIMDLRNNGVVHFMM